MSQWKDVSSYSRGDKERKPSAWEIESGNVRICVHRYVGLDGWFVSTRPDLLNRRSLKSVGGEDAKREAVQLVLANFRELLASLEKLGEEIA